MGPTQGSSRKNKTKQKNQGGGETELKRMEFLNCT